VRRWRGPAPFWIMRHRVCCILPGRKGSTAARTKGSPEVAAKRASDKAKSEHLFGQARKPAKMFRAGLYARVSTNDQQTLPMQSRAMREYVSRRGWTITLQVREVGSGAAKREAREKMLEAARRRKIDVVLVWRLDR
jgi:predicted site-specific integrase-resolvase